MSFAILRRTAVSSVIRANALSRTQFKAFSVFPARFGAHGHDDHHKEVEPLLGSGAKAGTIPTDLEQATGLERFEILAKMEGKEFFDLEPLTLTHYGTKQNPILVKTCDDFRFIGCSGFPSDTHENIWITVEKGHDIDRCPECGCVYKYEHVNVVNPNY
ncbi:Cytochrome c oxidase subunit 4 [Basidiobolus ranarum]|uniref:Cytochrome c oxidase subunit 4 n=1 Tax=Basidiobolus ranarum TaxID=34480 RepID=A0ABR2W4G0_9FUNG